MPEGVLLGFQLCDICTKIGSRAPDFVCCLSEFQVRVPEVKGVMVCHWFQLGACLSGPVRCKSLEQGRYSVLGLSLVGQGSNALASWLFVQCCSKIICFTCCFRNSEIGVR